MTYDCRPKPEPGSARFPCNVTILDPATGDRLPNVFLLRTDPPEVRRFVTDIGGQPMVDAGSRRVVTDRETGRVRVEHDRLELVEFRPWVAVAKDGGVVARSEGAG